MKICQFLLNICYNQASLLYKRGNDMKKKKFKWCIFTVMLALFNFFLVMQAFAEPTIDILIPSAGQSSVIPPGKDFYV